MGSSNARPLSGGRSAALSCPAALSAVRNLCNRCRRCCHCRCSCAAGPLNGPSCLDACQPSLMPCQDMGERGGGGDQDLTLWIDTNAVICYNSATMQLKLGER